VQFCGSSDTFWSFTISLQLWQSFLFLSSEAGNTFPKSCSQNGIFVRQLQPTFFYYYPVLPKATKMDNRDFKLSKPVRILENRLLCSPWICNHQQERKTDGWEPTGTRSRPADCFRLVWYNGFAVSESLAFPTLAQATKQWHWRILWIAECPLSVCKRIFDRMWSGYSLSLGRKLITSFPSWRSRNDLVLIPFAKKAPLRCRFNVVERDCTSDSPELFVAVFTRCSLTWNIDNQ